MQTVREAHAKTTGGIEMTNENVVDSEIRRAKDRIAVLDTALTAAKNDLALTRRMYESAHAERDGDQKPIAWLRFWAAQRYAGHGDIEYDEGFEVCKEGDKGVDGSPAFPAYAAPASPASAPVAPTDEIAGVNLAQLLQDLEVSHYDDSPVDLAFRCSDSLSVIKELLSERAALAAPVAHDQAQSVPEEFVSYFQANYYGLVEFDRPEWHAERLWRAAIRCVAAPLPPAATPAPELTDAARDVLGERERQISVEGWTPAHDDQYENDELAQAAACYAMSFADQYSYAKPMNFWPWDMAWWKPQGTRRNLVKAGALILAEIERLDRAAAIQAQGSDAAGDGHADQA